MADVLLRYNKDLDPLSNPYYRLFRLKDENIRNASTGEFAHSVAWAASVHRLLENTRIKDVFPLTVPDLDDGVYMLTFYDNATAEDTDTPVGDVLLFMPSRVILSMDGTMPVTPDAKVRSLNML